MTKTIIDKLERADGQCPTCHQGRSDADTVLGQYWCALERLAAPNGVATVSHGLGDYGFDPARIAVWTVTRSRSPGPVEGWSKDFRTGEKRPHKWSRCPERSPALRAGSQGGE